MEQVVKSALFKAAALAANKYPEKRDYIKRGMELNFKDHVQLSDTKRMALVTSQNDGKTIYTIHYSGKVVSCSCPNYRLARNTQCKHIWAMWLLRKAFILLKSQHYAYSSPGQPTVLLGNVGAVEHARHTQGELWKKVAQSPYPDYGYGCTK